MHSPSLISKSGLYRATLVLGSACALAFCLPNPSLLAQVAAPGLTAPTIPAPVAPAAAPTKPAASTIPAPVVPVPATPSTSSPLSPSPMVQTPIVPAPAAPAPAPALPTGESVQTLPAASPGQTVAAPAAPKPKPKPPIREWALSDDPTPSFQPETFFTTVKASERYAAIVDAGGWPLIPAAIGPGAKGKAVAVLRKRLMVEEDLPESASTGDSWDAALTEAVKHFQKRNGLRPTGSVTGATLRAINVPARIRFRQLASSAQRLAGINFSFGDRYVVVNIPSAAVEAVENGEIVKRYVAVVGDVDHRSPEVEAKISAVNLNPTWTVPTSIIKNEIIPKMRKNPGYLAKARIRILDSKGAEISPGSIDWSGERAVNYTLRQDSGVGNSLGSIRIQMNNKHSVYMHDTPSKGNFSSEYRFLSHGCVRVQGVYDFASWLLDGAPGAPGGKWDRPALQTVIGLGKREDVKLPKPVPVIWVYMTGWASANGTVHFADDVYQVDSIGLQADAR